MSHKEGVSSPSPSPSPSSPLVKPTPRPTSGWITEYKLNSDVGEVGVFVKSKSTNISTTLPKELYLTHIYRLTVRCSGQLASKENLIAKIYLLNSLTKDEITKDGKPAIEINSGSNFVDMNRGEASIKVKFIDTSYHHGKTDFCLRISILECIDDSESVLLLSKTSVPFKVYSKKRSATGTPQNRRNVGSPSSTASLTKKYLEEPYSLSAQERQTVREAFVNKTPIAELSHLHECINNVERLQPPRNSPHTASNISSNISSNSITTPIQNQQQQHHSQTHQQPLADYSNPQTFPRQEHYTHQSVSNYVPPANRSTTQSTQSSLLSSVGSSPSILTTSSTPMATSSHIAKAEESFHKTGNRGSTIDHLLSSDNHQDRYYPWSTFPTQQQSNTETLPNSIRQNSNNDPPNLPPLRFLQPDQQQQSHSNCSNSHPQSFALYQSPK